ncbi:hypothetical protein [Methylomonas sp. AM2-LC]|uniref:hypothetical protein n=1 Tax=Methylomonas sp. AM2-LC TaxID=3153301 RepID=UPI0032644769
MDNKLLLPKYTPRFDLSSMKVIGLQVNMMHVSHKLTVMEVADFMLSKKGDEWISELKRNILKWSSLIQKDINVIFEISGLIRSERAINLAEKFRSSFPNEIEIMINSDNLSYESLLEFINEFSKEIPRKIKIGLSTKDPFQFDAKTIPSLVSVFEFKSGQIAKAKEDIMLSAKTREFISELKLKEVSIVVNDLNSRGDVSCAILAGGDYGQGYFLSRESVSRTKSTNEIFDPLLYFQFRDKPDRSIGQFITV